MSDSFRELWNLSLGGRHVSSNFDGENFDVNLNVPTSLSSDAFKNCKLSKNLSEPIWNAVN